MSDRDAQVPNLPGYGRSGSTQSRNKQQTFYMKNGYAVERAPVALGFTAAQAEMEAKATLDASRAAAAARSVKPVGWREFDRMVLEFSAYFKEAVVESPHENFRVRKCVIQWYLEDGSVAVHEHKEENSGLPQGTFIKRHIIPGLSLEDLQVGADVTIYARTFHVNDANASTRAFLGAAAPAEPFPEDKYTQVRAAKMQRETGADGSVYRGVMMTEIKSFVEANLGKFMRDPQQLEQFLQNDRKVLRFYCYWDDTASAFGAQSDYILHYFLGDDTIEIREVHTKNSGRVPYPRLLNRGKLPKGEGGVASAESIGARGGDNCVHWTELQIGGTVIAFSRTLTLYGCDAFTRIWYQAASMVQSGDIDVVIAEPPKPERKLPPSTGYGTEEDSLGSVYNLVPKAPKVDMKRYIAEGTSCLRFRASLVGEERAEVKREFVVQYFLADNTISIQEPPIRNSGIWGGRFMARKRCRKADGSLMSGKDLYLGAEIGVSGCVFVLEELDEYTMKIMEARPAWFPASNPKNVLGKIGSSGAFDPAAVLAALGGVTVISPASIALIPFGIELSEHERLTLVRHLGGASTASFDVATLFAAVEASIGVKVTNAVQERIASETAKGISQTEAIFRTTRSRGDLLQELRMSDHTFSGRVSFADLVKCVSSVTQMTGERAGMVCSAMYGAGTESVDIMGVPAALSALTGRQVKPF